MNISFLHKEYNVEFIPLIDELIKYIKKRNDLIKVNVFNETNFENLNENVLIVLTNNFNDFLELYCLTNNKRKVMVFTNNTKESYIRMLLMIIKHVSYIRCEGSFFNTSEDYKKYLQRNNRRLYNNIINFSKYVEKIN